MKTKFIMIIVISLITSSCSMGQNTGRPSDKRVITDMNSNKDGLIDMYCVKGKSGEEYWSAANRTWYWDRSVTVKRKANIKGAPNAVVIIRGLARYKTDGNGKVYNYYKFLVTDNSYEGIPAPSKKEIEKLVRQNAQKVFEGRVHNIKEIKSIEIDDDTPWVWHNQNSFTAKFEIKYREVASYTEIADCVGKFEIRFYRQAMEQPVNNLLASEGGRKETKRTVYTADQINRMGSILHN